MLINLVLGVDSHKNHAICSLSNKFTRLFQLFNVIYARSAGCKGFATQQIFVYPGKKSLKKSHNPVKMPPKKSEKSSKNKSEKLRYPKKRIPIKVRKI